MQPLEIMKTSLKMTKSRSKLPVSKKLHEINVVRKLSSDRIYFMTFFCILHATLGNNENKPKNDKNEV
jgi:hypothetical protein